MWRDDKEWYLHETSWRNTRQLGDLGIEMNFNIFKKFYNYTIVYSGAKSNPSSSAF